MDNIVKITQRFLFAFVLLPVLTGCRFSLFNLLPLAGSLDDSFGSDGKVVMSIGPGDDIVQAVAIQPDGKIVAAGYSDDGKIVAAGYSDSGSNNDFALVRCNTDGTLDTSFGPGGVVTTDFGGTGDYGRAVAVQPDGKIVAAGYSDNGTDTDFALVRYNTDGTPDLGFGSSGLGTVKTQVGLSSDHGNAVAIQEDGKIVVAGSVIQGSDHNFGLVRYNMDGSLDTSFGPSSNGKVTTDFVSADDYGRAVAIQPDGKIVAAGYSGSGSNSDFALVRYNTDGSLDTSFGSGGTVTQDIAANDLAHAITIQKDQKIVVAGYSGSGVSRDFALIRCNTDGSLDASFGSGGIVTTDIGGGAADHGYAIALQSDGKIVVGGYSYNGLDNDFALVRALAIQPEGMIVAAGYYYNGSNKDFALACYWP